MHTIAYTGLTVTIVVLFAIIMALMSTPNGRAIPHKSLSDGYYKIVHDGHYSVVKEKLLGDRLVYFEKPLQYEQFFVRGGVIHPAPEEQK